MLLFSLKLKHLPLSSDYTQGGAALGTKADETDVPGHTMELCIPAGMQTALSQTSFFWRLFCLDNGFYNRKIKGGIGSLSYMISIYLSNVKLPKQNKLSWVLDLF